MLHLAHWIQLMSYPGVLLVVFAQTGLLVGFFLPGDSLLFTVGFLAAEGFFKLAIMLPLVTLVAAIGYVVAYFIGRRLSAWLLRRPDKWYFKKQYIHEAHTFYEKHGGKAIIFGRLIPLIRTFIPVAAGMAAMQFSRFLLFNIISAVLWAVGVTLLGFYLGHAFPAAQHYLLLVVSLVAVVSVLPGVIHFLRRSRA